MVSDGKLCIDAGQLLRQLVRFLFAFRLGAQKLAYSRFKNDSKLYQLLSIGNRLTRFPKLKILVMYECLRLLA